MKTSIYNNSFDYNEKVVIHNGISGKLIILAPNLYQLFNISFEEDKINRLKEVHIDFYNVLRNGGFLVDKNINELEICLQKMDEVDSRGDMFHLIINPTINCNFKCWYCYETHIKDSKINRPTIDNILKYINNLLTDKNDKIRKLCMSWFGGEPLLRFTDIMIPILEESQKICDNRDIKFYGNITTNGLLVNQKVAEISKKYNFNNFQITLDGHRDRHNKVRYISKNKGSYDQIVKNIRYLVENGIYVIVRINCSEETFSNLEKIIDDFSDLNSNIRKYISFSLHKVWQIEENLNEDMDKHILLFRRNGFKVLSNIFSINSSCYADKRNQVTINYNGDVFKCTARDFKSENREGVLTDQGTVIWNDKYQNRFYRKHKNRPCLECSILPICKGGCSQNSLERKDYCLHNFDNDSKKEALLQIFLTQIENSIIL